MCFSIGLEEGFKNHIEELRALYGDFNKEVFFWDIIVDQTFISREHAKAYLEGKVSGDELNKIIIKEVSF